MILYLGEIINEYTINLFYLSVLASVVGSNSSSSSNGCCVVENGIQHSFCFFLFYLWKLYRVNINNTRGIVIHVFCSII